MSSNDGRRRYLIASSWGLVFSISILFCFSLFFDLRSRNTTTDLPARLAALGRKASISLEVRELPVMLEVDKNRELGIVSDSQLAVLLSAGLPTWSPEPIPLALHTLKLWGADAKFGNDVMTVPWSGRETVDVLLSDAKVAAKTVPLGGEFLSDSPFGIRVARLDNGDGKEMRGESHFGYWLLVHAEVGTPSPSEVRTSSGSMGTLADVIKDATMILSPGNELEFITPALSLWLAPRKTWVDQFGQTWDFDRLLTIMMDRPLGEGACAGCHVPYAIVIALKVDDECKILSSRVRVRAMDWLSDLSRILELRHRQGYAGLDWAKPDGETRRLWSDNRLDEIMVLGHHLEWIALAPPNCRPRRETIVWAIKRLVENVENLPVVRFRSFKSTIPISHAARALCLLAGESPFDAWSRLSKSNRLINTDNGFRLKVPE